MTKRQTAELRNIVFLEQVGPVMMAVWHIRGNWKRFSRCWCLSSLQLFSLRLFHTGVFRSRYIMRNFRNLNVVRLLPYECDLSQRGIPLPQQRLQLHNRINATATGRGLATSWMFVDCCVWTRMSLQLTQSIRHFWVHFSPSRHRPVGSAAGCWRRRRRRYQRRRSAANNARRSAVIVRRRSAVDRRLYPSTSQPSY